MQNGFKRNRDNAHIKQTEVAEKLGVSQSTVSMWETGESSPRADMLPKIAVLYGCTVDELLDHYADKSA